MGIVNVGRVRPCDAHAFTVHACVLFMPRKIMLTPLIAVLFMIMPAGGHGHPWCWHHMCDLSGCVGAVCRQLAVVRSSNANIPAMLAVWQPCARWRQFSTWVGPRGCLQVVTSTTFVTVLMRVCVWAAGTAAGVCVPLSATAGLFGVWHKHVQSSFQTACHCEKQQLNVVDPLFVLWWLQHVLGRQSLTCVCI